MLNYFFSRFPQWNRLCLNRCIIKQQLLLTYNTQMQRKEIFVYDIGPSISQFHRLYQKLSKIGILWFVSTFAVFSRLPLVFTAQASHSPNLHRHEKCMNREWFKQIDLICQSKHAYKVRSRQMAWKCLMFFVFISLVKMSLSSWPHMLSVTVNKNQSTTCINDNTESKGKLWIEPFRNISDHVYQPPQPDSLYTVQCTLIKWLRG